LILIIARQNICMKKIFFIIYCISVVSCEGPPRQQVNNNKQGNDTASFNITGSLPNEEYVMVTTAASLPLYVSRDQPPLKAWGKYRNVKVSIVGPSDWDIPGQVEAIEQIIASKPAGLLINGTDPGIANAINKAVAAGIPTVVYDSDIPSNRHCFLGSDWYMMGAGQGNAIGKLANGKKGKVAAVGILGMSNQEAGFKGLQDVLKKFPNLEFIGKFETHNTIEETARITADLINTHKDLVAVAGFTSETGPGIGLAIKELNKKGMIYGTNVDATPVLLSLLKEGVLQYLVDQKREAFVWYGAEFLYNMVHNVNAFPKQYLQSGLTALPYSVNTGLIEITPENINYFLKR
jgi:ribose transport system substrate-binding protein